MSQSCTAARANKRILIVGMHSSPHLHRWALMAARPDCVILIFPAWTLSFRLPPGLTYIGADDVSHALGPGIYVVDPKHTRTDSDARENVELGYVQWRHSGVREDMLATPQRLAACIDAFQPHVLHSMETQLAGYLSLETSRRMGARFPKWVLSSWGSDFSLFRKLGHEPWLSEICRRVDLFLADCKRDQTTAKDFGYTGPEIAPIPSSGGMDIDAVAQIPKLPPSERRLIVVKGYHNWSGRALIALSALMLVKEEITGFRVAISTPGPLPTRWAERISKNCGMDVSVMPYSPDHRDAMARLSEARMFVGIGISDGLPTTVLEAMALGVFPIQSSTSCVCEWVQHGSTGLIVSPHDTREIADAIARVAADDRLVDDAAKANLETVRARWDRAINAGKLWNIYERLM